MKTMLRALFLDDMESRHDSFRRTHGDDFNVTYVFTYEEFVEAYLTDDFDVLFLDHDLSEKAILCDPDNIDEMTGTDVAKWLVSIHDLSKKTLPGIVVHSLNPAGRARMVDILVSGGIDAVPMPFHLLSSLKFS